MTCNCDVGFASRIVRAVERYLRLPGNDTTQPTIRHERREIGGRVKDEWYQRSAMIWR